MQIPRKSDYNSLWKIVNYGEKKMFESNLQIQLQNHLAELNKMSLQSKRNCACFTPDGVVYTKIKAKRNHGNKYGIQ